MAKRKVAAGVSFQGSRPSGLAALLLLLILVLRIAVVLTYAPDVTLDQSGYEASAYRLATDGSFAYPRGDVWTGEGNNAAVAQDGRTRFLTKPRNAFTMPGYPAFRAVVYLLVGDGQPWRVWTRIAQALLSTVGAFFMYLLARRFGERAGIIALGLSLLYQPLATANSHLLTDVLFTYLLVATVYCFVRWTEQPSHARGSMAGLLFGLTLWVRPTIALWVAVAALLVFMFRRKERRRLIAQIAVAGLIAFVVICPWWIRNYGLYGRFVPLTTGGNATAIEAIRIDVVHQWPFPWESSGPPQTTEQRAVEVLASKAIRAASVAEDASDLAQSDAFGVQYGRLREQVLREYPMAMLLSRGRSMLTALAIPYAWMEWFPFSSSLTVALHLALLASLVVALLVFRRRLDAMLLASVPLYLVALHAAVIPFNRYVFPAMPFAIVLAAALLDHVIGSWEGRRGGFRPQVRSGRPGVGPSECPWASRPFDEHKPS